MVGFFQHIFGIFRFVYPFVSHTKYSVSLQSKTSDTNNFFRYFASVIIASVSLRSEMKGHPSLRWLTSQVWHGKAFSFCTQCTLSHPEGDDSAQVHHLLIDSLENVGKSSELLN